MVNCSRYVVVGSTITLILAIRLSESWLGRGGTWPSDDCFAMYSGRQTRAYSWQIFLTISTYLCGLSYRLTEWVLPSWSAKEPT